MQLGTPVVAYRDGGNPEAIESGRTGYLVPVGDPEAFVAPLLALLRSPDHHAEVAEAARAYALSAFSTERHVAQITRLYDELLGGNKAGPAN